MVSRPVDSFAFACVEEGVKLGLPIPRIAETYGLRHATVKYYVWILEYPHRYIVSRRRTIEKQKLAQRALAKKLPPTGVHRDGWTDQEEDRLRQMLALGFSRAMIGRELKRTRNSIAGKVHRLRQES